MIILLLQNKYVQLIIIFIACCYFINILSDFTEKIKVLFLNIRSFIYYFPKTLFIFLVRCFKFLLSIIFFPFTIIKLIKKYKYFSSLSINNSQYKDKKTYEVTENEY